ncbi:MAG: hypothetical protein ACREX3_05465 [Gammaproteobacteria bacterium]
MRLEPLTLAYIASPSYSGSTLMTFLLGGHPAVATVGELKAAGIGDVDRYDLARLPTIDKQTFRDNLLAMCAVSPETANVDYVATGGSSGEPLRFYFAPGRSAVENSYLVASWERAGFRLGQPTAEHPPLPRADRHARAARVLARVPVIGRDLGPAFQENIAGILAGSETVYQDERLEAERVFRVRYFSWYGHSEKLVLAAECEGSSDYHAWPTYGFMELLDTAGRR